MLIFRGVFNTGWIYLKTSNFCRVESCMKISVKCSYLMLSAYPHPFRNIHNRHFAIFCHIFTRESWGSLSTFILEIQLIQDSLSNNGETQLALLILNVGFRAFNLTFHPCLTGSHGRKEKLQSLFVVHHQVRKYCNETNTPPKKTNHWLAVQGEKDTSEFVGTKMQGWPKFLPHTNKIV